MEKTKVQEKGKRNKTTTKTQSQHNQHHVEQQMHIPNQLHYQYSPHNQADHFKGELSYKLFTLLAFVIVVSLCLFLAIFAVKYVITSTNLLVLPVHCIISQLTFDGWNFVIRCLRCEPGSECLFE